MNSQFIPLFNWSNGVIMIIIFGVVCLTLVGVLLKFMASGGKKQDDSND